MQKQQSRAADWLSEEAFVGNGRREAINAPRAGPVRRCGPFRSEPPPLAGGGTAPDQDPALSAPSPAKLPPPGGMAPLRKWRNWQTRWV